MTKFSEFMKEIELEAEQAGPDAVQELEKLKSFFRDELQILRQRIQKSAKEREDEKRFLTRQKT